VFVYVCVGGGGVGGCGCVGGCGRVGVCVYGCEPGVFVSRVMAFISRENTLGVGEQVSSKRIPTHSITHSPWTTPSLTSASRYRQGQPGCVEMQSHPEMKKTCPKPADESELKLSDPLTYLLLNTICTFHGGLSFS